MNKPVLVIMAAGMGSRYGGLKQLDPVGSHGQLIIDYSIYDAKRAGFETVVFVIKPEIEADFKEAIGDRVSKVMDVKYAYQLKEDLPEGYSVPAGRTKPWGTAHAALAARNIVDGPFAVINADDYYGPEAYQEIYNYLSTHQDGDMYEYVMVGYLLKNTVTENGTVARGVCEETADHLAENPEKGEYFLPTVVSQLIDEGKARVKVLRSEDKWYGVTYREDKPTVVAAISEKTAAGLYPDRLWEVK